MFMLKYSNLLVQLQQKELIVIYSLVHMHVHKLNSCFTRVLFKPFLSFLSKLYCFAKASACFSTSNIGVFISWKGRNNNNNT